MVFIKLAQVSAFVETVNLIAFNLKYVCLTFFQVVVNMILINMMMAIINMAFEEIKEQKDTYQNKFEIIEYIKRSVREITGVRLGFINCRSYFVFVGAQQYQMNVFVSQKQPSKTVLLLSDLPQLKSCDCTVFS